MLDKSSLPDLDNPAAVEAVAEQFGSIGQKTESIISSVSSGWVNVTEAYRAPEEISVSIAFRTPTEIAENLQSETNDLKGHIEDYAPSSLRARRHKNGSRPRKRGRNDRGP